MGSSDLQHQHSSARVCGGQLHGGGIKQSAWRSALGRTEMAKKSIPEQVTSRRRRSSDIRIASQHCPAAIRSLSSRAASRFVLALLLAAVFLAGGCGNTNPAPANSTPEVEVAGVVQKDVPIFSEWVATLDGYVNAQIQPQVTGYRR